MNTIVYIALSILFFGCRLLADIVTRWQKYVRI